MHCKSCESLLKDSLEEFSGINNVEASHITGFVKISFDKSEISEIQIKEIIKNEGYKVIE